MVCPKCGAQIAEGATFCHVCGTAVVVKQSGNNLNNSNNSNRNLIIAILAVTGIFAFIAAMLITFFLFDGGKIFEPDPTATPQTTATVTPSPSPSPSPTPAPTQAVQVIYVTPVPPQQPSAPRQTGYRTYYSSQYDFSCDYPDNFIVYDDYEGTSLYTVQSPDATAVEKICAKANEGETVSSVRSAYISAHSGEIVYESTGSDYFALRINDRGTMYYKYCKFKNGNIYWFEFVYPASQHEFYDIHVNNVYNSLKY